MPPKEKPPKGSVVRLRTKTPTKEAVEALIASIKEDQEIAAKMGLQFTTYFLDMAHTDLANSVLPNLSK